MKWLTKALVSLYCIFPTFGQNCKIYEGNSKNIYNNILKVKKPYEIKDAFSDIKKCQIKSEEKLKGIATYFLEEKKTENPFSILSILNYRQGASNYQKLNDRIVKSVMNFITALNYYDTSNHKLESQILTTDVNLTVEESENAKWQNSEFNLQEEAKKIPEKLIDIVNSFESEERLIFIQTLSALRTYFCDFYNTRQSNTNNINFENNSELSGTIINLNY